MNHRYPMLARCKANYYRGQFLKARDHPDQFFRDHEIAAAIGDWANWETLGEGKPALHWLMRKMPRSARREFLAALPDVRVRLVRSPHQIIVSQQSVFVLAD